MNQLTRKNSRGELKYLYSKEVTLRGGKRQRIYFFNPDSDYSDNDPNSRRESELPGRLKIIENPRNGVLVVGVK